LSFDQIGARWGTTRENAAICWRDVYRKLGTTDPQRVYELAASRLEEAGDSLPLDCRVRGVRPEGPYPDLHLRLVRHLAARKPIAAFVRESGESADTVFQARNEMKKCLGVSSNRALVEEARKQGLVE
jgi:hypothetical protein